MSKDNSAYAAVKALMAIVKNVQTKQEADDALATLQSGSDMQTLMQSLVGYKELKE